MWERNEDVCTGAVMTLKGASISVLGAGKDLAKFPGPRVERSFRSSPGDAAAAGLTGHRHVHLSEGPQEFVRRTHITAPEVPGRG